MISWYQCYRKLQLAATCVMYVFVNTAYALAAVETDMRVISSRK